MHITTKARDSAAIQASLFDCVAPGRPHTRSGAGAVGLIVLLSPFWKAEEPKKKEIITEKALTANAF